MRSYVSSSFHVELTAVRVPAGVAFRLNLTKLPEVSSPSEWWAWIRNRKSGAFGARGAELTSSNLTTALIPRGKSSGNHDSSYWDAGISGFEFLSSWIPRISLYSSSNIGRILKKLVEKDVWERSNEGLMESNGQVSFQNLCATVWGHFLLHPTLFSLILFFFLSDMGSYDTKTIWSRICSILERR